jgi:hypothetical protein
MRGRELNEAVKHDDYTQYENIYLQLCNVDRWKGKSLLSHKTSGFKENKWSGPQGCQNSSK